MRIKRAKTHVILMREAAQILCRTLLDRHRFLFRRGMVSDDTEHTCLVAQSLIAAGRNPEPFRRSLAWRFRFWLLGIPAGVGFATLRSIIRLWMGISPERSGVFSAGNGPAMRAAILGVATSDRQMLRQLVRVSSRMTHTDPKAEYGALAIALAARLACEHTGISPDQFAKELRSSLGGEGDELMTLISAAAASANEGQSTASFADSLGLTDGVSGYVYHSVPVAIHAWFVYPYDFRLAVSSVIQCGGDTDSTAAIVGGIVGSSVGKAGIPAEWLEGLLEWPRSPAWMEQLGIRLDAAIHSEVQTAPPRFPAWCLILRNLFFLLIVLFHVFRRLLPP